MARSCDVLKTSKGFVVLAYARSREGVLTVNPPAEVLPAGVDAAALGRAAAAGLSRFAVSSQSVNDLGGNSKEVFAQLGVKDPRAFMRRAKTVTLEDDGPGLTVYPTRRERGTGFVNDATRKIVLPSLEEGALGAAVLQAFDLCS